MSQCKMKEGEKIHFNSEVPRLSEMASASFVLTSHDGEPIYRLCIGCIREATSSGWTYSLSIQHQDCVAGFNRFSSTGLRYFRPVFPSKSEVKALTCVNIKASNHSGCSNTTFSGGGGVQIRSKP